MAYVSLHQHSWYSHDGKDSPETIAAFCAQQKQMACALTDHGNMSGTVDFVQACAKHGIKGLIGVEIYYQPTFDKELPRYHMTVIAQTQQGYENLCQMLSVANRENYYYFAVVTDDLIHAYHEGLLFASGCISSYVSKSILDGRNHDALEHIQWMRRLVGDRYYLEVQPFPVWQDVPQLEQMSFLPQEDTTPIMVMTDLQKTVNTALVSWGNVYNILVVMTSDSHFVDKSQFNAFRDSHKLRKKQDLLTDYTNRYMHTETSMLHGWLEQMGRAFHECGQIYIDETQRVADRCDALLTQPVPIEMPDIPWVEKPLEQLTRMVAIGMKTKDKTGDIYKDRVRYEMRLLRDKGYINYFHIVADFFLWCQNNNVLAQVRGSAVASVIAYFLGWHDIDPVVHALPFERFLSEARTDFPDVDVDMNDRYRDAGLAYMIERYKGNAVQIATFGRWQTRNLITALCKVYSVPTIDIAPIKYAILANSEVESSRSFMDLMSFSKVCAQAEHRYPGLIRSFTSLVGGINFIGTHAAGVVLSKGDITKRVAVQRAHGVYQTAVAKEQVTYLGLPKFDILGVRNLAVVQEALDHAGVTWDESYYDDPAVYQEFAKGRTRGIFQFDKARAQGMCKEAGVASLADIAIITACNRPGPIAEGTWEKWLKFRRNPIRPSDAPTWWDAATGDTFVFQENVMSVCHEAGFTPAHIDKMLKMLKKYHEETDLTRELRSLFVDGMMAKWSARQKHIVPQAEQHQRQTFLDLFESMRRYLFNKAHAWSYAGLAYKEMWIRYYHKRSWYLALLRNEPNKDLRLAFSSEAVRNKVWLIPPHVNGGVSYADIDINGKPFIQEGLLSLHGLGAKCAQAIVRERETRGEYTSREDFLHRFGFVELGDIATKTTSIRHYKPRELKHYKDDTFAKGVNSTAITALDTCGALQFDRAELKKTILSYNNGLATRREVYD